MCVEAFLIILGFAYSLYDDRTFMSCVLCDPAHWFFKSAFEDIDADLMVAFEGPDVDLLLAYRGELLLALAREIGTAQPGRRSVEG